MAQQIPLRLRMLLRVYHILCLEATDISSREKCRGRQRKGAVFCIRFPMKTVKQTAAALLLCLLLLFASCLPRDVYLAYLGRGAARSVYHSETNYADFTLSDTDANALLREGEALNRELMTLSAAERLDTAHLEALYARCAALSSARETLSSDVSLAYLWHCMDTGDKQAAARYEALAEQLSALELSLTKATAALAALPALADHFSLAEREALALAQKMSSESVLPLKARERTLIGEYEALWSSLHVSDGGRDWSYSELMADESLPPAEWYALRERYLTAYGAAAAQIYIELVSLRNEMAEALGFSDYISLRYAAYGRDYTPAEANIMAASVQESFVPLYKSLIERYGAEGWYLSLASFDEGKTTEAVGEAIKERFPALDEVYAYLRAHSLIDSTVLSAKAAGSFTTYFSTYGAPFLFTQWDGSFTAAAAFTHELGHCASYYLGGTRESGLDLCELDSQGMELLLLSQYEGIYGRFSAAARVETLQNAVYAVLAGCMEDAFQRKAYAYAGTLSADTLSQLYLETAQSYGFAPSYGYTGSEWALVQHSFSAPFYYISYAVSMLAALELWDLDAQDPAKASAAYMTVLERKSGTEFRQLLGSLRLADPLSPSTVQAMAARLNESLDTGES